MIAFKAALLAGTSPVALEMGRELVHGWFWGAKRPQGHRSLYIATETGVRHV